jgi:hypothetical protein
MKKAEMVSWKLAVAGFEQMDNAADAEMEAKLSRQARDYNRTNLNQRFKESESNTLLKLRLSGALI